MNRCIYAYRSWIAEFPDYTLNIKLKNPLVEAVVRAHFRIPPDVSVKPVLDGRMEDGGKKLI